MNIQDMRGVGIAKGGGDLPKKAGQDDPADPPLCKLGHVPVTPEKPLPFYKQAFYPFPRGDSTFTSYPASCSAHASFHTRVSNGTGRFSTIMSIFLGIIVLGGIKRPQQPR